MAGSRRYIEGYGMKVRLRCDSVWGDETFNRCCQKLSGHRGEHGAQMDGHQKPLFKKWQVHW